MSFDWSLNPYTGCAHQCTFCYVRAFEKRADRPSDDRYGGSIRVKVNVASILRVELARPSWKREFVAIGAATDPYQPAEARYRLTRACIEAFGDFRTPFGIITRGPLVVRDLDVLVAAAQRAKVSVTFSIPTLDEEVWRKTEPHAPPPRQRIRAMRILSDAGVTTGVSMAPILPGLSDRPEQLAEVMREARNAGASHLWTNVLYLRPGTREHFLENLQRDWPEELPRYEKLYARNAYLKGEVPEGIKKQIAELRQQFPIADRSGLRLTPPQEPDQLELAI